MRQVKMGRRVGAMAALTLFATVTLGASTARELDAKCPPNTPDCSCKRSHVSTGSAVTHPRDVARLRGHAQIIDLEHIEQEGPSGELQLMQDERTLRQLSKHSKQCLSEEVKMSVVDYSIYMSFMPTDLSDALLQGNATDQQLQARIEELHTMSLTCRLEEASQEPSQFDLQRKLLTKERTTSTFEDMLDISARSLQARKPQTEKAR